MAGEDDRVYMMTSQKLYSHTFHTHSLAQIYKNGSVKDSYQVYYMSAVVTDI